jgi:uncharacterized protein (TIGR00296 family)
MTFRLSLDGGSFLVKLSREAIGHFLDTSEKIEPPKETPKELREKSGVFVTINSIHGEARELRGCIGYPYPTTPLVEATIDSAINAAVGDPRFPPLNKKELDSVVIEVSVLTPLELNKVGDPRDHISTITIGKDGLVVERGWCKGLLLPQVPVEMDWDKEDFLSNCCLKAGLSPDSWLLNGTKVYRFQAIIFKETSPNGEVRLVELGAGK